MTTTEKRLTEIADRLGIIARAASKLTEEHAQGCAHVSMQVSTSESGVRITLYSCANCGALVESPDHYCHACGRKLIFPQPETEAEHAAD